MMDIKFPRRRQALIPGRVMDWYDRYPLGAVIVWAAVSGAAVDGAVLLLARSRYAWTAVLITTIAAVANLGYHLMTPLPPVLDKPIIKAMPYLLVALMLAQWLYARRVADNVLR